jgi:hypothetical protein
MASTIQLYFQNTVAGVSSHMMLTATAPASLKTGTGWTHGTQAASKSALLGALQTAPTGSFTSNGLLPNAGTLGTRDAFRTQSAYYGTFGNQAWSFAFLIGDTSADTTGRGYMRVRLYRSPNQNGSSATEITTNVQCSTLRDLSTTTSGRLTTLSFSPGQFTANSEYLFVQMAWAISTAWGNVNRNALISTGTSASIITAQFGALLDTALANVPVMQDDVSAQVWAIRQLSDVAGNAADTFSASVYVPELSQTYSRMILDSMIHTEVLNTLLSINRTYNEGFALLDNLPVSQSVMRDVSEMFRTQDSDNRTVGATRNLIEGMLAADDPSRSLHMSRTLQEVMQYGDVIARYAAMARTQLDGLAANDAVLSAAAVVHLRALLDGLQGIDATSQQTVILRDWIDACEASEVFKASTTLVRLLCESSAWADLTSQITTRYREIADDTSAMDVIQSLSALSRIVVERVHVPDVWLLTAQLTYLKVVLDAIPTDDKEQHTLISFRALLDEVLGWDHAHRSVTQSRETFDQFTLGSQPASVLHIRRDITETSLAGDLLPSILSLSRTLPEQAFTADTARSAASVLRSLLDQVLAQDSTIANIGQDDYHRVLTELMSLIDRLDALTISQRERGESGAVADSWTVSIVRPGSQGGIVTTGHIKADMGQSAHIGQSHAGRGVIAVGGGKSSIE